MNYSLILQYLNFGLVGFFATLIHASLYHLLMSENELTSLVNNFFAFIMAFFVSLIGQFFYTFKNERSLLSSEEHKRAIFRFFIVAIIGLMINSFFSWIIVDVFMHDHRIFIAVMVVITPVILFIMNKTWVFERANN